MKTFLSYTRSKDQFQKVSQFRERLEAELAIRDPGSTVFQDKNNLLDGAHFPEAIATELKHSDVLLALVSPAWLRSEWCRREFALFTDDATNNARLHRILPVLWVDTPELSVRSLDLVARTLAQINYSDWRDLRYESWDDPRNQRQVGKLAQSALALLQSPSPAATSVSQAPGRLSAEHEKILAALNSADDGLQESALVRITQIGPTRVAVFVRELQQLGHVRDPLRVGQRESHWLISTPGQAYLVAHNLAA